MQTAFEEYTFWVSPISILHQKIFRSGYLPNWSDRMEDGRPKPERSPPKLMEFEAINTGKDEPDVDALSQWCAMHQTTGGCPTTNQSPHITDSRNASDSATPMDVDIQKA